MKPIVFINGDGGTGRVAPLVWNELFKHFPKIDVPMTVQDRIHTNDGCITHAVEALMKHKTGFKNSTGSDHPEMKRLGWKSANIVMRPLTGAYAMLRMLQGPGRYSTMCGTLRYAYGDIYDEKECSIKTIDGKEVAVITQHLNLTDLTLFAQLALKISREHNLKLILSSKSTISESEFLFRKRIEDYWKGHGLSSNDFVHKLTDIAIADLPIITAMGSDCSEGGFLHVAGNLTGDTSSDVIDLQHGNRVMGSRVYCDKNGISFTYEELPGGTAEKMSEGELRGGNFLNPTGIIFAIASAIEVVNPDQKRYLNKIRKGALSYLEKYSDDKNTIEMLKYIQQYN